MMNINDFGDVNESLRIKSENDKKIMTIYTEIIAFIVTCLTLAEILMIFMLLN